MYGVLEQPLESCWAILQSLGFEFSEEEIKYIFATDNYYINRARLKEAIAMYEKNPNKINEL